MVITTEYTFILKRFDDCQKTNSNNTKAFVHILVNFFSCVLT